MNELRKENLILQGKTYAMLSIVLNSESYRVQAERCFWLLKKIELNERKRLTQSVNDVTIEYEVS